VVAWTVETLLDGDGGRFVQLARRDRRRAKFSVSLTCATKRPRAGGGFLPFGKRGSFYTTRSRWRWRHVDLEARWHARASVADRRYDHQWGNFYVSPFRNKLLEEYEWMSIQLDSGDELL
jgi:hypothetical protein